MCLSSDVKCVGHLRVLFVDHLELCAGHLQLALLHVLVSIPFRFGDALRGLGDPVTADGHVPPTTRTISCTSQ